MIFRIRASASGPKHRFERMRPGSGLQGQHVFPCCKFPRGPASSRFVWIMEEDPQISEEEAEDREWIESLEYVIENSGRERAAELLRKLRIYSQKKGVEIPYAPNNPYANTISLEDQHPYSGNSLLNKQDLG